MRGPTEDLYYLLGEWRPPGLSLERLVQTSRELGAVLGRELPAMATRWLSTAEELA